MIKKYELLDVIGFFTVVALGILWHFVYELTGSNEFIGYFFPINESVFEHFKLFFFPYFLYALLEASLLHFQIPSFFLHKAFAAIVGTLFIMIVYYTGYGAIGGVASWANIIIFIAACAISQFLSYSLRHFKVQYGDIIGICIFILGSIALIYFTYHPLSIPLFIPPFVPTGYQIIFDFLTL